MAALRRFFGSILARFRNLDVFVAGERGPSSFFVYAHDIDAKRSADAKCVGNFIKWLSATGAEKILSDKSPLPRYVTREGGTVATRNVLSNQFSLLPRWGEIDDPGVIACVNNIILCGSKLLQDYYQDEFASTYIKAILECYTNARSQKMSSEECQDAIRRVVEAHTHENGISPCSNGACLSSPEI